jgi:hypothetical protein
MLFYVTASAFFAGVFLVRYHLELLLFPVAAGFFAYYLKLGLQSGSPVQNPEKLYKERGFVTYATFSVSLFAVLMFTRIPLLYDVFHVEPAEITALWTLGATATP